MCIKVNLGIKIEILPVVFKHDANDPNREPFVLYRPETNRWEDGFARYHQRWLSAKNSSARTQGNFIPTVKVMKHIRSLYNVSAVSFHIECLLYAVPDAIFAGGPADSLASVFRYVSAYTAEQWYRSRCMTPCGDRDIFTGSEWWAENWWRFHELVSNCSRIAQQAITARTETAAIEAWQAILGRDFFPARVL